MASQSSSKKRRGNFLARYVDPLLNASKLDSRILAAETLAKLVAILITSLGFYVWGASIAEQYGAHPYLQIAAGLIFAVLSAWITDMAFSDFLENSLFSMLSFFQFKWVNNIESHGWYITLVLKPLKWVVVTIIVAALFWADYTSVYTLRSPIANAQEKTERVELSALNAEQQRNVKAAVGPLDAEIKQVRADISRAERDVTSANAGLKDLADKGNRWAPGELQRKKDRATSAARKRLKELQADRDQVYKSATLSAGKQLDLAIADNTAAQRADEESKESVSTLFTFWGFGTKCLTILFRLLLVINFLINNPNWDVNGDGVVDGRDVTAAAGARHSPTIPSEPTTSGPSPAYADRRIGFKHYDEPEGRTPFKLSDPPTPFGPTPTVPTQTVPTVPHKNTVEQCTTAPNPGTVGPATVPEQASQSLIADVREWQKRAQQTYKRSRTQLREEKRIDNRHRATAYCIMLQAVGVEVTEDETSGELRFKEPAQYTINSDVAFVIKEQREQLESIGKRRGEA